MKSNDNYQRLTSNSHPLTIDISFSAPGYLRNIRSHSSLASDELSPSLHFLPVFSPYPSSYSGSTATTPKTPKTPGLFNGEKFDNSTDGVQSRSNRNNIDLTNGKTPPIERKHRIVIDVSHKYESKDNKESTIRFPDQAITPARRRSSSANYILNSHKNK